MLWYDNKITNALAEGVNSLIQTTKRIARGYRNVENFIRMCFLKNGHIRNSTATIRTGSSYQDLYENTGGVGIRLLVAFISVR